MKRVVILGGGTGGAIAANQMVRQLRAEIEAGEVEVTVISNSDQHVYQPLFLYLAFDLTLPADTKRPERRVLDRHIQIVYGEAERVDRQERLVVMADGTRVAYDFLVIATGSRPAPEQIEGLVEGGHHFYTEEAALKLRDALQTFTGGRVVIVVGVPHKCPVAPLEFTFMLQDWLDARGLGSSSQIVYTYPIGRPHSLEGVAEWVKPVFERRRIESHIFFNPEVVDPVNHTVTGLEGDVLSYDLLVAIPPHVGQDVIGRSGLGDSGNWVPTDRYSLLMQGAEDIYVLGDATNLPISKAGSTAHFQADVVAQNIVHRLHGGYGSHRYDGKVFCFIETGLQEATYITFDYERPPQPVPPGSLLHLYKVAFNRMYWLSAAGLL
jgi:sulfide:quinone oxidoreductase